MKHVTKRAFARREFLLAAGGLAAGIGLESASVRAASPAAPAAATVEAIRRVVGGAVINPGKVKLELPELVDNGNAVPLTVRVDSPMTHAAYVRSIHVFTQKNPLPDVAGFRLGPRSGRATVSTRVRLADTQTLIAIAEMSDGSFWSGSADVVVTIAACLEEL